ncbi:MAG: sigma-70 family RNA polymerase sigma factor [Planctomycetota bacterium]
MATRPHFASLSRGCFPSCDRSWSPEACRAIDVDEIVQRTFVEAYKSIGQYQADSNFKAWLLTIARYQTMMESTRIRRQADYHSRYLPVALADQMEKQLKEPGSEDERLAALRDCLAALKSKSRQLIRRRYAEDLSMDDIAAAVNRSSGAVRKELCLLRKQLHQCIGRKLKLNNDATQGA